MQIRAIIRTERTEVVEVSMGDIFNKLHTEFRRKAGVPNDAYINGDRWETWDDCRGHGSGLTTVVRKATPEECEEFSALQLLQRTMRDE